jgi:hypothetical protein
VTDNRRADEKDDDLCGDDSEKDRNTISQPLSLVTSSGDNSSGNHTGKSEDGRRPPGRLSPMNKPQHSWMMLSKYLLHLLLALTPGRLLHSYTLTPGRTR